MENKFFTFRQNNSGGRWTGPAKVVIVEAVDANQANSRAESIGLYFNGAADGLDCECCGDRWAPVATWLDEDSYETPTYYRKTLEEAQQQGWINKGDVKIYHLDGREEIV